MIHNWDVERCPAVPKPPKYKLCSSLLFEGLLSTAQDESILFRLRSLADPALPGSCVGDNAGFMNWTTISSFSYEGPLSF